MRRWHEESPRMLIRWREELRKHDLDPAPYVGAYLRGEPICPAVCRCEKGPGPVRKKKPGDCGRPQRGLCHPHKRFSKGRSRQLREYRTLLWEMRPMAEDAAHRIERTSTSRKMRRAKPLGDAAIYQIKATLTGIHPRIWRRLHVGSDISLHRLHRILQSTMGWHDYHLYQFEIDGANYGEPDPEWEDFDMEMREARTTRLSQVVSKGKTIFTYEYDFGDSWRHELLVEQILPPEAGVRYPVCLGGERACPPEDCGGIGGYAEVLRVLEDPTDPEYEEMRVWVGMRFDPEAFDLARVNARLERVRPRLRSGIPRTKACIPPGRQ